MHTPCAFQLPGGRPPGPPDAPPDSRGSALHPVSGGARTGASPRPAVRYRPSLVHCCPPHRAAGTAPKGGGRPPEERSSTAPTPSLGVGRGA